MENEDQLNKIRGLLAKAEATNFPKEAEAYTAKAMELISKWGIDESLLAAKEKTSAIGDRIFKVYAPFARDKITFFNAIVNALGGRAVFRTRSKYLPNPGYEELHVFATETDLARIDILFTSLLVQCSTAMQYAVANGGWDAKHRQRKFKSDFLYGFTEEVGGRLYAAEMRAARQAEQQAAAQGTSTALVLIDKRKQVDRRVEDVYDDLETSQQRRSELSDGYGDGVRAGRRADLGDTRINTGAKQGALVG